jgi:hypothetical protein
MIVCDCRHADIDHAQPGQGRTRLPCEYSDCECENFSPSPVQKGDPVSPIVTRRDIVEMRKRCNHSSAADMLRWVHSYEKALVLLQAECSCTESIRCQVCRAKAAFLYQANQPG